MTDFPWAKRASEKNSVFMIFDSFVFRSHERTKSPSLEKKVGVQVPYFATYLCVSVFKSPFSVSHTTYTEEYIHHNVTI